MSYLDEIIYIIKGNQIFIDYTIFKKYATSDKFNDIVNHTIQIIQRTLLIYPTFELHVNLCKFNISSLSKYKDIIQIFINNTLQCFSNSFTHLFIYHTPSIMTTIFNIISKYIHNNAYKHIKIKLYNKDDSENHIYNLKYQSPSEMTIDI